MSDPAARDDARDDFARPLDFTTKRGGPREFARRTAGSRMETGESSVLTPDETRQHVTPVVPESDAS